MIGKSFELTKKVTEEMTAAAVGSGDLRVLATPVMIALFEQCSAACLSGCLETGKTSVGVSVTVHHTAATPVGGTVRVTAEITAAEGKGVTFCCHAYDEAGAIGDCTHQRVIVSADRFLENTYAKLK